MPAHAVLAATRPADEYDQLVSKLLIEQADSTLPQGWSGHLVGATAEQAMAIHRRLEADDAAVRKSSVFVDTFACALTAAGALIQPLASGALSEADIRGDLFGLARGGRGRTSDSEITLFKSVGTSLEDLSIATLCYEWVSQPGNAVVSRSA